MAARILKIQVIYEPFQFLSPTHITNHFALSFINSFWRTIPAIPFMTPFQSNTHKTVITGKGKNAKFSAMSHEMPKSDINLKSKSHSIMFGGTGQEFWIPSLPAPISLRSKITRHTCNVFISLRVSGQNWKKSYNMTGFVTGHHFSLHTTQIVRMLLKRRKRKQK